MPTAAPPITCRPAARSSRSRSCSRSSAARCRRKARDGQLVPFLQNLERYGFIPDPVSAENPFGLPVGWTVTRSLLDTTVVAGFNCTACHVGELMVGGKSVRVDGAPNLLRINDLFKDLKTELDATIGDGPRMARLGASLIRNRDANEITLPSPASSALVDRMQQKLDALSLVKASIDYLRSMKTVAEMGAVENGAVENGYGRVDAFGSPAICCSGATHAIYVRRTRRSASRTCGDSRRRPGCSGARTSTR